MDASATLALIIDSHRRGLRIAKSGRCFWIEDVTVWMLVDAAGATRGQAATYRRWRDA